MTESIKTVVIDNGTGMMKVGFAGDVEPTVIEGYRRQATPTVPDHEKIPKGQKQQSPLSKR